MSIPLFYHNNQVDPLIPAGIKSALYYYDEYQTYDLIYITNIRNQLKDNIKNYFGFVGNTVFNSWATLVSSEYCLIERFTPFDVPWANQYSEKLYNLMEPFAGTQLNPYLLGENHPKANLVNFGNQYIDNQYEINPLKINLIIPANNQETNIYISWIEYALVDAYLPEYNKKYKVIKTKSESYEITLYFNYLQPCSIVFSCDNEEIKSNLESQVEDCYLYSKFDLVANDLSNKINQAFPKINQILAKIRFNGSVGLGATNFMIHGEFQDIDESDFINIPNQFYRNHYFISANNNVWNSATSYPSDTLVYIYDFYISSYPVYRSFDKFSLFFTRCDQFFPSNALTKIRYLWGEYNSATKRPRDYFADSTNFEYLFNYLNSLVYSPHWAEFVPQIGIFTSPIILGYNIGQDWYLLIGKGRVNDEGDDLILETSNIYPLPNILNENNENIYHPINISWQHDLIIRNIPLRTSITDEQFINLCDQNLHYSNELLTTGENEFMPDSIRLKEIHEALNAQKFAIDDSVDPPSQRFANLGYYIERIARILGINVNPDGSVRSIRQSKFVKQGDEIPAGWSIGQWGRNQGGDNEGQKGGSEDEDRDGLAYEVRSNKFAVDKFSGEATAIEQGGYVLVENLPQLLHIILSDLDKALGWAEAGANVLPNPNGEKPIPYEGLNTLLAEVAFMLSQLSRNITGTHISALKNQGMLMELIAHQGVLTRLKEIEIDLGIDEKAMLVYPSLNGMTEFEQNSLILSNLSLLIGSFLKEEK